VVGFILFLVASFYFESSNIAYLDKFFSLKLNDIIGGNYNGSPTAINFLQLNFDIGSRLYGSSIYEHSSSITILNYIFFITSKFVAAQVAPITLLLIRASYLY
jgi:hypothetical protein